MADAKHTCLGGTVDADTALAIYREKPWEGAKPDWVADREFIECVRREFLTALAAIEKCPACRAVFLKEGK